MESIYKALGTVIGFCMITLLVQSIAGEKAAQNLTLLVLVSILILNANNLVSFAEKLKGD